MSAGVRPHGAPFRLIVRSSKALSTRLAYSYVTLSERLVTRGLFVLGVIHLLKNRETPKKMIYGIVQGQIPKRGICLVCMLPENIKKKKNKKIFLSFFGFFLFAGIL